ncbi:MAG: BolA/IbaG family iron-sulfur metabolism protein, partial [Nitrosomonas ureae]
MMNIKNSIEHKLLILRPQFLEVVNESYKHNVLEGSESHFKVTIVSDEFNGKMLLTRHRMV